MYSGQCHVSITFSSQNMLIFVSLRGRADDHVPRKVRGKTVLSCLPQQYYPIGADTHIICTNTPPTLYYCSSTHSLYRYVAIATLHNWSRACSANLEYLTVWILIQYLLNSNVERRLSLTKGVAVLLHFTPGHLAGPLARRGVHVSRSHGYPVAPVITTCGFAAVKPVRKGIQGSVL